MHRTHDVLNQSRPPLLGHDVLATDVVLAQALHRHGGGGFAAALHELGRLAGTPRRAPAAPQPTPTRGRCHPQL